MNIESLSLNSPKFALINFRLKLFNEPPQRGSCEAGAEVAKVLKGVGEDISIPILKVTLSS